MFCFFINFDLLKKSQLKILDKKLKLFIESRLFSNYILLIVIGNTITLSLNGLIDSSNDEILRNWNIFFVSMFTFEMILKIVCYRIKCIYFLIFI